MEEGKDGGGEVKGWDDMWWGMRRVSTREMTRKEGHGSSASYARAGGNRSGGGDKKVSFKIKRKKCHSKFFSTNREHVLKIVL